jgi:leucyl-tRNA synthetase
MDAYEPQAIETKWQRVWEEARAFHTPDSGTADGREFYLLEMLPYPSGTLHVGQVRNYTQGDVLTHFHRRNAKRVMRPMGFDSFGLNAENAAIRDGGHPREIIRDNIQRIRAQMKRMGWAIDWDREVAIPRASVLPLDAVAVPAVLQGGSGVPQGSAGQVVSQGPDRARE